MLGKIFSKVDLSGHKIASLLANITSKLSHVPPSEDAQPVLAKFKPSLVNVSYSKFCHKLAFRNTNLFHSLLTSLQNLFS